MTIQSWLPHYQELIEWAIKNFFDMRYLDSVGIEKTYEEALRYAVEWGGKRLRPILAMIAYEYNTSQNTAYWETSSGKSLLLAIIGIEFIHCYTLVHDDLPCMDNDELRRGKPTVWKRYGETMAVLVWDTLQTMGFELLSLSGDSRVIHEIARALWDFWVARGQVRDTFLRHDTLTQDELLRVHDEKTGIFIVAALMIGTFLWNWGSESEDKMRKLGILLGRAFQIRDDILDAVGDMDAVWKKTKKDIALGKWIVALIWLTESKQLLDNLDRNMSDILEDIHDTRVRDLVNYVIERTS